ncbi:unnamed protein product [Caenorhabditis nigoni]
MGRGGRRLVRDEDNADGEEAGKKQRGCGRSGQPPGVHHRNFYGSLMTTRVAKPSPHNEHILLVGSRELGLEALEQKIRPQWK